MFLNFNIHSLTVFVTWDLLEPSQENEFWQQEDVLFCFFFFLITIKIFILLLKAALRSGWWYKSLETEARKRKML